jgi:hypothetical protein
MPKGGKRPGADRPKGALGRKTIEERQMLADMVASGETPMAFMMAIMRNPDAPFLYRFKSAETLMRFVHPALASVEQVTVVQTHEERLAEMRRLLLE